MKLIENELGRKADINMMPAQTGDVDKTFANIQHAKDKYNYKPSTRIENGLKRLLIGTTTMAIIKFEERIQHVRTFP